MPANATPILILPVKSASALTAERFVTATGGVPAAGAKVLGVNRTQALAADEIVPVTVLGTEVVVSGAAIAADADIQVDNQGRAITLAAGVRAGRMAPGQVATAADQRIEVILAP